jgi:hypothetical protein
MPANNTGFMAPNFDRALDVSQTYPQSMEQFQNETLFIPIHIF